MILPLQYDFAAFAEKHIMSSRSQWLQDLFAIYVSDRKLDGYFVEFGALNGVAWSNSYLLERLGWNGVVAEPHPTYGDLLRSARSCHVSTKCVYTETGKSVEFLTYHGRPAASAISGMQYDDRKDWGSSSTQVETITLPDLLSEFKAPSFIDFLSIDTEGSEHAILQAHDFDRYLFGAICVEHNYSNQRALLLKLLTERGYMRVLQEFSGHDDWYVHRSVIDRPRPAHWNESFEERIASNEHDNYVDARYSALSVALETAGRCEAALEYARKAHALTPDSVKNTLRLGALLVRNGQGDEASRMLKPLVDAGKAGPEAQYQLGLARMLCGDLAEAKRLASAALSVAPGNGNYQGLANWL